MAIRNLVFHKLTRWQDDQPSSITHGPLVDSPSADHQALFSQFKKLFQFRAGKLFGEFSSETSESHFKPWLQEVANGSLSFLSFSEKYLSQLKELVDKTPESLERHVLMIDEDHADGDRFWVFLLEDSSGLMLESDQSLNTIDYLNTSKLELALKVDINNWRDGDGHAPYLTVIKGRGAAKLGEAFVQSIGFQSSVDTQKETETLMEILASYTKDSSPEESTQVRQRAYDFCVEQQQLGEAVPLTELSGYLDENQPSRFAQYAEEQASLTPEKELRPDTRKLKHLVRMSGKGNGLSLSFSSDLFQQTILYDEQSDTLTITSIPKTLKKQLTDYLKEKQG